MGDNSRINSTERLLDIIRENDSSLETPHVSQPSKQSMPLKRATKKNLTGGVVIQSNCLCLVLTGGGGDGKFRDLLKWAHVPVPKEMDIEKEPFVSFLKSAIDSFFRGHKNVDLWSVIDSKNIKLRNILVPDLPESKLPNAAFWGLKKEVELDAAKEIFDYHVVGTVQAGGGKKKNLLAFSGLKTEIKALKNLFAKAGYSLAGITAIPFALQNFVWSGLMRFPGGPVTLVNVARHHTEITCLYKSNVQLVRTIRTGSQSLVEALLDGSDDPGAESVDTRELLSSGVVRDGDSFAGLENGAGRLMGKVLRTGDYCSNNYAENEPIEQYLFFGETDNCQTFMAYAAEQTAAEVKLFDPFEQHSPKGLSTGLPDGVEERSGIIPALGLALSTRGETPNFLHTYVQRNAQARIRKLNTLIMGCLLVSLLGCFGFWWWQDLDRRAETVELKKIQTQVANYVPRVNGDILNQTLKKAGARTRAIKEYVSDYLPLAVINELCSLTPESIDLVSFEADFRQDRPDKQRGSDKKKTRLSVRFKGVVHGDYTSLESTLTGYVIMLEDSPLFGELMLLNKNIESMEESRILKFTADMEIF